MILFCILAKVCSMRVSSGTVWLGRDESGRRPGDSGSLICGDGKGVRQICGQDYGADVSNVLVSGPRGTNCRDPVWRGWGQSLADKLRVTDC